MPRGRTKLIYNSSPGGIRGDLNPATIPDGEWLSSSNWLSRRGVGVPRPGYAQLGSTMASADAIIGIHPINPVSTSSVQYQIQTATKSYWGVDGGSYTDITGTWTTEQGHCRMVSYKSGGTTYVLRVSPLNAVDSSSSGSNNFANIAAAPAGYDITVVGPYVVVATATASSDVQWNSANDISTWPSSNIILTDEADATTACRALNARSFAFYKRNSVHVATLQAAKVAFQSARVATAAGPTSPASLVDTPFGHFWLAHDGVIRSFDGASVRVVSTAVQAWFNSNALRDSTSRGCGAALMRDEPEIWWFVYSTGVVSNRAICLNITTGKVTVHQLQHEIRSCSQAAYRSSLNLPQDHQLILGGSDGKLYLFGSNATLTDAGTAIPWNFEFGYRPLTDVEDRGKLDGVSSYFKKTSSSCTVTVSVTLSDGIDDSDTATTDTFDTNTAGNHLKTFRSLDPKKWIKLKYSGTQVVANLEYRGSIVTAWERSMI